MMVTNATSFWSSLRRSETPRYPGMFFSRMPGKISPSSNASYASAFSGDVQPCQIRLIIGFALFDPVCMVPTCLRVERLSSHGKPGRRVLCTGAAGNGEPEPVPGKDAGEGQVLDHRVELAKQRAYHSRIASFARQLSAQITSAIPDSVLPTGTAAADKFRIGLEPAFGQVDALVLFFLGDPDAEYRLDYRPNHQRGDESPGQDCPKASKLREQRGVLVGKHDRQQPPHADHAVYRNRAYRVVYSQFVQPDDRENNQYATDCTDYRRQHGARRKRFSRDRDQTGQRAVQRHGQVGFSKHQSSRDKCGYHPAGSGHIGVDEHQRHGIGFTDIGQLEFRTAIEAEPAQPENEGTQRGERHVGAGNRIDLTVRAVLALSGAKQQDAR